MKFQADSIKQARKMERALETLGAKRIQRLAHGTWSDGTRDPIFACHTTILSFSTHERAVLVVDGQETRCKPEENGFISLEAWF